jgi:hypothetical protein
MSGGGDSSSEEGDDLFYQQAVFVDEFGGDTLAFEHETVLPTIHSRPTVPLRSLPQAPTTTTMTPPMRR